MRVRTPRRPSSNIARAVAVGAVLVMSVGLVACSEDETVSVPSEHARPSDVDVTQWAMPLDDYIEFSPELHDYVESLLVGKCLIGGGYNWPVPGRDASFSWPANFNSVGHRLFDVSIASQWGYHDAPARDEAGLAAQEAFNAFAQNYEPSDGFADAYDACLSESQATYTSPDFASDYNLIAMLKSDAYEAARDDVAVIATLDEWRSCVRHVLPDVPDPSSVLADQARAEEFGLWGANRNPVASEAEVAVAVTDATCQEKSGYAVALYDAQWSQESKRIAAHEAELVRIKTDGAAHEATLMRLFEEHAPSPGSNL